MKITIKPRGAVGIGGNRSSFGTVFAISFGIDCPSQSADRFLPGQSPAGRVFHKHTERYILGMRKGDVHLDIIGDIFSVEDFERILAEFPRVDSIMLGRGILADPGLMGRIKGKSELDKEKWRAFLERLEEDFAGYL